MRIVCVCDTSVSPLLSRKPPHPNAQDPKVVLDIGANVGFFSASTILAFQPPCERYRGTMAWARHVTEEYRRKQWCVCVLCECVYWCVHVCMCACVHVRM